MSITSRERSQRASPEVVDGWSGEKYANALRHDPLCEEYDPNFRQILHVGYKIAAEMGKRYLNAIEKFEDVIAENVTENIYERHLKKIFSSLPV